MPPKPTLWDVACSVQSHTCLLEGLWQLVLHCPNADALASLKAGQFVMLALPAERGFSFRRPFSPFSVSLADGTLTILYKVVGDGTQTLSRCQCGDALQLLLPLGTAFPADCSPERTLLLGGGIGLAPLLFQAAQWQEAHPSQTPRLVYGTRTRAEIDAVQAGITAALPPDACAYSTNDGSLGQQGTVLDVLKHQPRWLDGVEDVLLCGPNVMMAACVAWLQEAAPPLRVWVSLENHMPCGTGACFGCVVAPKEAGSPRRVCLEGPVFNAAELAWTPRGLCSESFESVDACYPRFSPVEA